MEHFCPAPALVPQEKRQFVSLEWLRFGLGFYLVLFHTLNGFNYPDLPQALRRFFDLGFFSTSTFFVLSGFLLAHVYLKDHASPNAIMKGDRKTFWIKRFANLYPIHVGSFMLIVTIFMLLPRLGISPGDKGMSLYSVYPDTNDWQPAVRHVMSNFEMSLAVGMNALLIHAWNPFYLTFNIPSWSISTLMFLYLLFPALAPLLHRFKRPGLALVAICLLYMIPASAFIFFDWFGSPQTGILHRNPLIRLPEFLGGIALCALWHRQMRQGKLLKAGCILALTAFVLASLLGAAYLLYIAGDISKKGNVSYFLLHDGLLLPAQLALIYLLVQIPNPSERWASIAKPLGNCSLSLFALHIPIFMIFARVDRVVSGSPGLCFSDLSGCFAAAAEKNIWHYPIFLVVVVVISLIFQKYFVEPCRAKIEGALLKPKAPAEQKTLVPQV